MALTIQELVDARAHQLDTADDIVRTIKEANRPWTDEERATHDAAIAEADKLEADIARAKVEADDVVRSAAADVRRGFTPPNVNFNHEVARANRTLDELLWATDDVVRAGTLDKAGGFRPNLYGATNPVEQVVIRSDVNDPGKLAPRISEFRPQDSGIIRNFQKTVADMAIFGMLVDKDAKSSKTGFEVARGHRMFKDRWTDICRALDVDTSAEGTEWVPTGIGASLHEKVRAAGKIAPLFARINLPTNPWKWPIEGADATAYRVAEPTGDSSSKVSASTPGTAAATFDAEIIGARTLWSRSLDADSVLAILGFVQMKLVRAFVDGEEKAILDGDTDGTHQDTDVQALGATDVRSAWDGLRKKGIAQTVPASGQTTTSAANLALMRKAMGLWGVNPADLAFIIGVSAYNTLLADTSLLTVDKLGPQATILNGQIGSVHGVPVIVSEHVREVLNASGVEDGITQTKTYNLAVNRNEWAMGQRMALDVEIDDSIYRETFQRVMVGFMREDFQHIGSAATNDDTCIAYNITP